MNKRLEQLHKEYKVLTQGISRRQHKIGILSTEGNTLRQQIENYQKLIKESQEELHHLERHLSCDMKDGKKIFDSSEMPTVEIGYSKPSIGLWISKRDERRQFINKKLRRNYSLELNSNHECRTRYS